MTDPANEVHTKETITKKMRVPADRAWDAIRQFGRLDVWFPSMIVVTPNSYGFRETRDRERSG